MDCGLFKKCNIEDMKIPSQAKFKLKPQDEISLDSIYSAILDRIEPTENEFPNLKWNLPAKELLGDKQAIIFEEKLYISKFRNNKCKHNEETKIFLESELKEIGELNLKVEECYDGYVVYVKSKMIKHKGKLICGHCVKGRYDDKFNLIGEKRSEYDFGNNVKTEKTLNVRICDDKLISKRETKINNNIQRFNDVINIKGRDKDVFLLEGGVMLLMRHLIVNNFRGDFNYFSINIIGQVKRCQLTVHEERKQIKMFHRTFKNVIRMVNTQYCNNCPTKVSETYYCSNGKMILHYWHDFNYIMHETKGYITPREPIMPKFELMWRNLNNYWQNIIYKRK